MRRSPEDALGDICELHMGGRMGRGARDSQVKRAGHRW